ncbi:MAG TPA: glycosyltransferase family 4 protein [Verrucomicrobiae bacterium]|nr:glycosyltransferase family 4 protein [Verrucomicrobiae bacterium]
MAKRLKVLISAYACEPDKGSEPADGWNWALQMRQYHDVWVVTRENNRQPIEHADAEAAGIHWVYVDLPKWLRFWKRGGRGIQLYYYLWQLAAYFKGRRLYRECRFDIIHHVTFGKYWIPSFLGLLPAPFIFGPVGGGESTPRGFIATYSFRGRLHEYSRNLIRAWVRLDPFSRRIVRRAALLLGTTEETARQLRLLGGTRVSVHAQFAMNQEEMRFFSGFPVRNERPFRLISIARLIHWKGTHLGIRAFAEFIKTCPESEYWIINTGPEIDRLKKLAAELGVADKAVFWGKLPKLTDVFEKLAASDVLVHPALHEAFGNVCLEAMAAGRPVICLDIGGPALQVTDETGFRATSRSPAMAIQGLADAMKRLYNDTDLRVRMGQACRERVRRDFSWEEYGKRMSERYLKIAAGVDCS